MIRALDDFDIHLGHYFRHGTAKHRALIATIGVEFQQERIHAEHGRHDQCAAIAILNVGGVHDGVDQQALRIDKNVPLLALDLLSRVVTRPIDRSPPFSALFTLWLSITAAVYRKPKPAHNGDEVRQGLGMNLWNRSAEPGERPAHLCPMNDAF